MGLTTVKIRGSDQRRGTFPRVLEVVTPLGTPSREEGNQRFEERGREGN